MAMGTRRVPRLARDDFRTVVLTRYSKIGWVPMQYTRESTAVAFTFRSGGV